MYRPKRKHVTILKTVDKITNTRQYVQHAKEVKMAIPQIPTLFLYFFLPFLPPSSNKPQLSPKSSS